jgi:hypothetical protein
MDSFLVVKQKPAASVGFGEISAADRNKLLSCKVRAIRDEMFGPVKMPFVEFT